ncbi:erythromycin biosynthesis sensory transduction protein eryC1 [Opitutaceae bacterium EW11]|nr:erythromycin biosynthesis sensory transduction protein eryC1 [Opitutaceae bacterium EW11]
MLLPADPKANYLAHAVEIRAAIDRVLASGHYILGPEVEAFEKEFARYCGVADCISVANGTEAIEIALRALGLEPGVRVATVANTVTATISAIQQAGLRPVFVEIDPTTMVMDPEHLEKAFDRFGSSLRAVIPVHLYGHPAPMPEILKIAAARGATVIEDCAQAHGASLDGRKAGNWAPLAAFSFYPTKNVGALGDGGAITARDSALADRVRLIRQYGWKTRYVAEMPGRNSRLDELQAAILRVKLAHLDAENAVRRKLAGRYLERLKNSPLRLPQTAAGVEHAYHQFVVRTPKRDALKDHLQTRGIACGVLYPIPIHHQPAYRDVDLSLPETEKACAEVLCLPCHPGLSLGDIDSVCDAILGWSGLA